jgi:malonyl CoA-acyl carrier protein transacylase/SAM-dependent methyltransferase/aryl carrier-like protein
LLRDLCYTAKTGRTHFSLRLALFAANTQQMNERLAAFVAGQYPKELQSEHILPWRQRQIVFLFPDQGSQYVNMAYQLYQTEPTFRNTLTECDRLLHSLLPQSVEPVKLLSVLYPASGATSPLNKTTYTQPALFALEYALAQMWLAWGIEPAVVMGHGVGEYVAACIAGLLSLEDGLKLIAARGHLMQSLSDPHTNSRSEDFEQVAREVTIAPLRIPLVCNLTGQLLLAGETIEADYWRRYTQEPVQFATAIQTLATHGYELFLELGPAPALSNMGKRCLPANKATWLPSLDQDHEDWDILMQSVASLYCKGFDLNWSNFDGNAHKVALPTYPFEREYCWLKHEETEGSGASPVNWETLVSNCQTYRQTLAEPLADAAFLQVWQALQQIYLCVISKALQDFGIFGTPNEHYSVDELIQHYAIHPRYTKWLHRNLAALVQAGRDISINLQEQNGTFTCEQPLPAIAVDELWHTYQTAVAGLTDPTLLEQGWDGHIPLLLFQRLADLKTVLTEELHSAETYVSTEMREIYRLLHFSNTLIRTCVEEVVRLTPAGKKIRLLEVGAGFGTTTAYILPTLQATQTEYVYTDISAYFLQEAREKFAAYPNVSYALLDIEKNPHAQGYTYYDFDIVIAANVLHTTAHIAETLRHIRSLLKPHAILILLEVTHMSPLLDLTMGLQQGFDRFEDTDLCTSHPLLSRDMWHKVLREQGFVSSAILNKAGTLTDFLGLDVVLAQAPTTAPRVPLMQVDEHLRSNLPEYTIPSRIPSLETLPLTAKGKVDHHAPPHPLIQSQEHAKSLTEARTPTEKTLVQLWSEVLQLSDVGIDNNFLELGGDSLLATKLLTRIRATFNIDISMRVLFKNPTIALLAQTIEQGLAQGKDARSLPTPVAPALSLDKEEGVL